MTVSPNSVTKRWLLASGSSGSWASDLLHPGRADLERRQVRLGEVAVIVGFFLAALGDGHFLDVIPAEGFLDDLAAGFVERGLALDFIGGGARQGAETVQVLDLGAGAEFLDCRPGGRKHSLRNAGRLFPYPRN